MPSDQDIYIDEPKRRLWGIVLLGLPVLLILLSSPFLRSETFLNVWAAGFGLLFTLGPVGIVLIKSAHSTLKPDVLCDERSGKGPASEIPPEIQGWNWGASYFGLWWGIYYRVNESFMRFIPFVGSYWWVVMGQRGNELAWRARRWQTVAHFIESQDKWKSWVLTSVLLAFILLVLAFLLPALFGARRATGV